MTVRQHTTFFRKGKPASAKLNYLAVMIAMLVSTAVQADEPFLAYGLGHAPLGDANLGVQTSGNLVVSNIGSSGQDSVSINLGEVDPLEML